MALGGIVDNSSQEQANGDSELIRSYNCTADPLRCSLRLIHRD
jgi:hypothetical protein